MTISYVASVIQQGNSAGSGTSGSIDTTPGNFVVSNVVDNIAATAATMADSAGNTWVEAVTVNAGVSGRGRIMFVGNTTTSSTHTFSANGTGSFASVAVAAYSAVKAGSPLDQTNGFANVSSNTTVQPGSITPSENNELCFYTIGDNAPPSGTASVNIGTIRQQASLQSGVSYANAIADNIQTSAAAINPTWSFSAAPQRLALIASFKVAVAAAGSTLPMMGVG